MLAARDVLAQAMTADLFCGSGALGLEALSRGARHVTFVDNSKQALQTVRSNAGALGVDDDNNTIRHSVLPRLPALDAPLTLVFLDPPYETNLVTPTLEALNAQDRLVDEALIICETGGKCNACFDLPAMFSVEREKSYGDTMITLLTYQRLAGK